MKILKNYFGLIICLLLTFASFSAFSQLIGTWQHSETGAQIRFENKTYQNYDHIGYYAGSGNSAQNYYMGEDVIYLTNLGNNTYSGYLKGKTNPNDVIWIADTWTINGNNAYSSAKGNFVRISVENTFPNIAGTWYQNGNLNQPCTIGQNGQYLAFQLGNNTSQGYFSSQRDLFATDWNANATLSNDYQTITWSDQTWTKGTTTTPSYPAIDGTWYQNGNSSQPCTINQNGQYLAFQLGTSSSQGYFTSQSEIFASDWNVKAALSADAQTISWGDQSWTRGITTTPSFPAIEGTWYQNGNSSQPCTISQNGQYLAFQVGTSSSQGYFTSQSEIFASDWNVKAALSADAQTISWGDQSWTRGITTTPSFPTIGGTWYQNGNSSQPCTISQNGQYLAFQVGTSSSQGYFTSQSEIFASDWNVKAALSADAQTITWSDQTWTRSAGTTPPITTGTLDPNKYYRIVAGHSGKVLDVWGGSKDNGANVYQWDWHGGDNQIWKIEALGDGYYRIISKNSGNVLEVAGASKDDGANVQQWGWNGGSHQQWDIKAVEDGYFRIISKNSGKVLDIKNKSKDNSANLMQQYWAGAGNPNQRWKIEDVSGN